jgi:hypothetical protein
VSTNHSDAEAYLVGLNKKIGELASQAHQHLIDQGCTSYVKTIYIGYDFNGEMVAALYGHVDYVEVAIALPENFDSPILIDASHLTWRTLPVAAVLKGRGDLKSFAALVVAACRGVLSGSHTVLRDNEFFAKTKREKQERGVVPKQTRG